MRFTSTFAIISFAVILTCLQQVSGRKEEMTDRRVWRKLQKRQEEPLHYEVPSFPEPPPEPATGPPPIPPIPPIPPFLY
ncbi:hypothetical protein MBANPS3_006318 [Mucor bainieri]